MREGKIERIKKEENSILERIIGFKEKEIEKGPGQWNMIEPKLLLPEAIKIFELIESDQIEAAGAELENFREKIETIKSADRKASNDAFLTYFDDIIGKKLAVKANTEIKEQDNT